DGQGKAYKVEAAGGRYRVVIENIYSNQLNKMFTVVVNEGGTDYTFQACALSYANNMLAGNATDDLKNVCKALYLYNEAAIAAFGAGN
ncbi:MAG: hypothetical protein J6H18_05210, partial [Lachnospiraceae bacterium]|nr:hypothetical protein [Lachnospiraceae bacterium]